MASCACNFPLMRWLRTREIWLVSLLVAALLVWSGRFFINPDGISYLDLSDDFRAGRFSSVVNGHWSPAYPFLLSLWLGLLSPEPAWEATAVHVLNGLLFVLSMVAFELFLRELRQLQLSQGSQSRWALDLDTPRGRFCAWMIFLWCAWVLVTIRVVTPDMLLAAIVLAAAALIVRIERGAATLVTFATVGALLGIGYLTKSLMFPVSIALLALSMFAQRHRPGALPHHLGAVIVFLVVSLPQIVALSADGNGLRFSDSGRLAYSFKVNRFPRFWTGLPERSGTPLHPIRQIDSYPATFVFASNKPDRTYPIWDEPAVWYRGMTAPFNSRDQLEALKRNAIMAAGIALKVLVPVLIVFLLRERGRRTRIGVLAATSAAVMLAYLFLHTEGRLTGVWLAILAISVLAGVPVDTGTRKGAVARGLIPVIAVISAISLATYVIDQAFTTRLGHGFNARHLQESVAEAITRAGVLPGSKVALVGDESDIYWARLSDVQVSVQIPLQEAKKYWQLSDSARSELNRRIAATGADAVIASWTAPDRPIAGWTQVEGTRYSILPLN